MRRVVYAAIALLAAGAMSAAEKTLDLAAIIDPATAEKILGEPVKKTFPLNTSAPDGYHSKCIYFSAKSSRSLNLRLRLSGTGNLSAAEEFDRVTLGGSELQIIKGLGDHAGYLEGSEQNGLPEHALMLYVVKSNAFITVGLSGLDKGALEKAENVARKILTKL